MTSQHPVLSVFTNQKTEARIMKCCLLKANTIAIYKREAPLRDAAYEMLEWLRNSNPDPLADPPEERRTKRFRVDQIDSSWLGLLLLMNCTFNKAELAHSCLASVAGLAAIHEHRNEVSEVLEM